MREGADIEVTKESKMIKLKKNKLSQDCFAYIRRTLLSKYKGPGHELLIISRPCDFQFELLAIQCVINMLKGLVNT